MQQSKDTENISIKEEGRIDDDESSLHESRDGLWISFLTVLRWYPKDMPHAEKKLVLKLDLLILVFGCLSFFTKYLDQSAITNAYVSGMKADLHLQGNQINYITVVFWASYCVSMIPACYYLTRSRINIVLPALEAGWGLFTFGCAWAQNVETIYAMRFFVGICESCSFTGVIYVIGSWFKPGEIGRRVAFFYLAAPLGTMFAGYLQSGAYTNLNHVHGVAGWRWLFIVCTIITLPICILGFIAFPDVPHRSKPRFLTASEHALANSRLVGVTEPSQLKVSKDIFKRVFARWHWYVFVAQWTLLDQNALLSSTPFNLYLSAKPDIYSVSRVNTLPTTATAISVVTATIAGIFADKTGRFDILSLIVTIPMLIGAVLLVVWNVGENGRLAAFIITGSEGAISPLTMGWATITMANDAEERAIVTASMNAIGQAFSAWSQLLQYPAVDAPNFRKGFISSCATSVAQIFVVGLLWFLTRSEQRRKVARAEVTSASP